MTKTDQKLAVISSLTKNSISMKLGKCSFSIQVCTFSLEKKVDKMEHSIGSIIAKLDAVLVKTGVMQEGDSLRVQNVNILSST